MSSVKLPDRNLTQGALLSLQDITYRAGKKIILDCVSFSVGAGQTVGLVGHNGAGKTSLFQLILGFRFAQKGAVEFFSKSYLDPDSRKQVGYVPERPYLSMEYSLKEELLYYGRLQGLAKEKILAQAKPLLERFKLSHALDQKLKTFSKGMLQKTLLVQALLHDPIFLILDEPMSGLDPDSRDELRAFFREWKAEGKSLLYSSHAPEDIAELSDSVIKLEHGKITFSGTIQEWRSL